MYGGSNFDEVAPDKTALLPSQTASFANYTSFDRGINVVVIDVDGPVGELDAADFVFRVGNDNNPDAWV